MRHGGAWLKRAQVWDGIVVRRSWERAASRVEIRGSPAPGQCHLETVLIQAGDLISRSRSGGQVERRSGTPESWALGLGERALASATPLPPLSEPEPSGRDLSGGWEGTAPGKEEGAIPGLTGPRCHFSFLWPVTADKWDQGRGRKKKTSEVSTGQGGPSEGQAAQERKASPGCAPTPPARSLASAGTAARPRSRARR